MSEKEVLSIKVPPEYKQYIRSVSDEEGESINQVAFRYLKDGIREEEAFYARLRDPLRKYGEETALFGVMISIGMYVFDYALTSVFSMFMSFVVLSLVLLLLGELCENLAEKNGGVISNGE